VVEAAAIGSERPSYGQVDVQRCCRTGMHCGRFWRSGRLGNVLSCPPPSECCRYERILSLKAGHRSHMSGTDGELVVKRPHPTALASRFLGIFHPRSTRLNLADLLDALARVITSPALSNLGAGPMKPAVGHVKWLVAASAIRRSRCQRYARPLHVTTKSWSDRELRPDQAKLRRRR
jgi:hypothetical protein